MGIYSTIFVLYLALDYLMGFALTQAIKYCTDYDVQITWLSIHLGWSEVTISLGPLIWRNPKKFQETPFLLKLGRVSLRLSPRSVYAHLAGGGGGAAPPVDVDNFEVEGVKLHLERNAKGLNLWAALGVSDEEGQARADESRACDAAGRFDPAAFDDDGTDEAAPGAAACAAADDALARLRVERICVRGCRFNVDAFLKASKTKADAKENVVKIRCLELVHDELRPSAKSGRDVKGGLHADEVVSRLVWRVVDEVTKSNAGVLLKAAAGAAADQSITAVKNASNAGVKATGGAILNAGHRTSVKVHDRLKDGFTEFAAEKLEIWVLGGKHLAGKPSAYLKLQIGKKGVKAKTKVATASSNPAWHELVALAPVESLDLDLRVQVYDRRLLQGDAQQGATLKLPLADLEPNVEKDAWFVVPPADGDATAAGGKEPAVHLKLRLVVS